MSFGSDSDDLILRALKDELRIINKHIPYRRISLCELIDMSPPYIILRDGTTHLIDRRELQLLADVLEDKACSLKIPIIIEASPSLGEGVYKIRDPIAALAVAKILGLDYNGKGELIFYRPQLYELRTRLRTTTTIIFTPT